MKAFQTTKINAVVSKAVGEQKDIQSLLGVSYKLYTNIRVSSPSSFMSRHDIADPDECGKNCDMSDDCTGGWYDGIKKECWSMYGQLDGHRAKLFFQVDSQSGLFEKTGTLNQIYSSKYLCALANKC